METSQYVGKSPGPGRGPGSPCRRGDRMRRRNVGLGSKLGSNFRFSECPLRYRIRKCPNATISPSDHFRPPLTSRVVEQWPDAIVVHPYLSCVSADCGAEKGQHAIRSFPPPVVSWLRTSDVRGLMVRGGDPFGSPTSALATRLGRSLSRRLASSNAAARSDTSSLSSSCLSGQIPSAAHAGAGNLAALSTAALRHTNPITL
jgi:hypothetical protein